MPACTFFGDRDCFAEIDEALLSAIERLITKEQVDTFYVGCHGNFDRKVQKALNEIKSRFLNINCFIVLAYIPKEKREGELPPPLETIFPEGMENCPPKYAILRRNRWMIEKSDFVITYPSGFKNSSKMEELAFKKGKKIIRIEP